MQIVKVVQVVEVVQVVKVLCLRTASGSSKRKNPAKQDFKIEENFCGLYWIRTSDPYPVKVML